MAPAVNLHIMLQAVHHVTEVSNVPVCSHHSQLPQRPKATIMPAQALGLGDHQLP